jgi:hypothetical protein
MTETTEPRHYLLIDDNGDRSDMFLDEIAVPGQLEFSRIFKPHRLRKYTLEELGDLDGIIIDFHLDTSTAATHEPLTYQPPGSDDDPVPITTGLGVMLWLKAALPGVPLFSFCESTAPHARMFMTAAWVWLESTAIDATDSNDAIRQVLIEGDGAEGAFDINHQIRDAAGPFSRWMDSLLHLRPSVEAYDWLQSYRFCGSVGARAEFERRITARYAGRTISRLLYGEIMSSWQSALAEFLQAFEPNVDLSGWPDLSPWPEIPDGGFSPKIWDANNPVLDYINHGSREYFFTDADVRAALSYHRIVHPSGHGDHAG